MGIQERVLGDPKVVWIGFIYRSCQDVNET